MRQDVERFIGEYDICIHNKTPRDLPFGQLTYLPSVNTFTPKRPWTHINMDFIVELSKSGGRDTLWVIVFMFSRMAHFVPLSSLPSADTLATLFIQHVVKLHGIPEK